MLSVEPDAVVEAHAQATPTGVRRVFADENAWLGGGERVDVDVAVIDTGLDTDHPDLVVAGGVDCRTLTVIGYTCVAGGEDDNGHGTHVGGTIAALDDDVGVVGVAPGARLWAVKVLGSNGSGSMSGVVAGVDWVAATRTDADPTNDIAVVNMSLGCACTVTALDAAIARAVDLGVAFAVSAGNSDADASGFSPARHPEVLTVSALADFDGEPGGLGAPTCRADQDDTLADFSNWGTTVDVAAPGVCIYSTLMGGLYGTKSGTSMASPHVAGALALLASGRTVTTRADVEALYADVTGAGNLGWMDDADTVEEPLLDVGDDTLFAPVFEPTDPVPLPMTVASETWRRLGGRKPRVELVVRVTDGASAWPGPP